MKTTIYVRKIFAHYKTTAVNLCISTSLFCMMLLLNSCKKNLNDVTPQNTSSGALNEQQENKYGASVATDWYKMQLRFLLEKNSVLANGAFFGYIGIGLYESVRYINPNSISLSEKLYQMPRCLK